MTVRMHHSNPLSEETASGDIVFDSVDPIIEDLSKPAKDVQVSHLHNHLNEESKSEKSKGLNVSQGSLMTSDLGSLSGSTGTLVSSTHIPASSYIQSSAPAVSSLAGTTGSLTGSTPRFLPEADDLELIDDVSDDLLDLMDEPPAVPAHNAQPLHGAVKPWRILVVDDEPEVHAMTRLSLMGSVIFGRPLELISAMSAEEGLCILKKDPDFALALIDVVMESQDAGLRMVRSIRNDLHIADLRIVLRTGQPGMGAEQRIIEEYDIEDYRLKTDLSRAGLITLITALLRGYRHLTQVRSHAETMALLAEQSKALLLERRPDTIAHAILSGIKALTGFHSGGAFFSDERHIGAALVYTPDLKSIPLLFDRLSELAVNSLNSGQTLGFSSDVQGLSCMSMELQPTEDPEKRLIFFAAGISEGITVERQNALQAYALSAQAAFSAVDLIGRLERVAYSDPLTKLANKRLLLQRLEADLKLLPTTPSLRVGLMVIDIDHFKGLNDRYGTPEGDKALSMVANRIVESCGEAFFPSRLSGDDFAVILRGHSDADLRESANALLQNLNCCMDIQGHPEPIYCSAGLALLPRESDPDASEMTRHAERALYEAKENGRARLVEFIENPNHSLERSERIARLRHAITHNEMSLHYQPKINLDQLTLTGLEALVRWRKDGELVSPMDFIPLAREAGIMHLLDEWVLNEAMRQTREWASSGLHIPVAVNLAPEQLQNATFMRHVENAWNAEPYFPGLLALEIVESAALSDFPQTCETITKLRSSGVKFSLDDFGTGYSSLSYLRLLPLDEIKIDQSFVKQMNERESDGQIVRSVIQLANIFNLSTVAEGVENEAIARALRDAGCHIAQGYGIARPMPGSEVANWVGKLHRQELFQDWTWANRPPLPAVQDVSQPVIQGEV